MLKHCKFYLTLIIGFFITNTYALINPSVPNYQISPNLSNIINYSDFKTLPAQAKQSLIKNAFVVLPGTDLEFFSLYEENRYAMLPNFITTDSVLHNYHLLFDYILKKLEQEKFAPQLKLLSHNMLNSSIDQSHKLNDPKWKNAALHNATYFAVANKLLDKNFIVSNDLQPTVNAEIALINAHNRISLSPLMKRSLEDYTQYIPRGHYNANSLLQNYFKAMMWYGRITFLFANEDDIRSAVLMVLALKQNNNLATWKNIYQPINFLVGKSDDIDYYQINNLLQKIYGDKTDLQTIVNDNANWHKFVQTVAELQPPKLNSIPVFMASLQPDLKKATTGFRFFGQRFTIDGQIFQNLITRNVGPKNVACNKAPFDTGRMLPKSLDIAAAMNSKTATNILNAEGEFAYACYSQNLTALQEYIAKLKYSDWTQNLYWSWLYTLQSLLTEKSAGFPQFMLNNAWNKKDLNTFLGSWTELKHDTILYTKQVYAEMGSGEMEQKDDRGYVEPNPELYSRLISLIKQTKQVLQNNNLQLPNATKLLDEMQQLTYALQTISLKELENKKINNDEYELIRSYGGQLEHFWLEAFKDEGIKGLSQLDQRPAAIVADVATDPNGGVLEETIGKVNIIYVAFPIDGKLRIGTGGVYSYYEFTQPIAERLTDKKWREMLDNNKAPEQPSWMNDYLIKSITQ